MASSIGLPGHQWNMPVESNLRGSSDFSAEMFHGAGGTSGASFSIVVKAALLGLVGLHENIKHSNNTLVVTKCE